MILITVDSHTDPTFLELEFENNIVDFDDHPEILTNQYHHVSIYYEIYDPIIEDVSTFIYNVKYAIDFIHNNIEFGQIYITIVNDIIGFDKYSTDYNEYIADPLKYFIPHLKHCTAIN